ncbi:unnamed protein product [Closterium sp. Naga37s-1]|nr:unnamed protein product [Closterium sp. Naga37s-1]
MGVSTMKPPLTATALHPSLSYYIADPCPVTSHQTPSLKPVSAFQLNHPSSSLTSLPADLHRPAPRFRRHSDLATRDSQRRISSIRSAPHKPSPTVTPLTLIISSLASRLNPADHGDYSTFAAAVSPPPPPARAGAALVGAPPPPRARRGYVLRLRAVRQQPLLQQVGLVWLHRRSLRRRLPVPVLRSVPPPTGSAPPPTGSAPLPTSPAPPPTGSASPPTASPPPSTGLKRMAYFLNFRGMDPSLIPAANLTHVFYSCASIDPTTHKVVPYIPAIDVNEGLYLRFNSALKTANPAIKTLLSIGSYYGYFTDIENTTSSPSSRSVFIQSAIALARTYNFDGLDIVYEYLRGNTTFFSALVTDFRAAIESEAAASGKAKLLLSALLSAYEPNITQPYDVPTLNKTLDFVNVKTYDLIVDSETPTTRMHTALEDVSNPHLSIKGAMAAWVSQGLAPSKAMVFTLSYKKIDQLVTTGGYTATLDAPTSSMYAVKGDHWVCYDDPSTITTKVQFAKAQGYGGWYFSVWGEDANNALLNAAIAAS